MKPFAPVLACVAAACSSPPIVQPPPASVFAPLPLAEFPGAVKVLDGFDERSSDPAWRAHDQTLFAMQLEKDGEVVRWLLHIDATVGARMTFGTDSRGAMTITGQQTWSYQLREADGSVRDCAIVSQLASVEVRVMDANGTVLTKASVNLPYETLGRGLLHAIDSATANGGAGTPGEEGTRVQLEAFLAIFALLDILRNDEALADYFWQVVDKPSLWSVITNFGISTSIQLPFAQSVAASLPAPVPPVERAFAVPLRIDVNGSPALFVDLLAAAPDRPYAISGGIIAAAARHPTRPDTTFRVQLLAACCGAGATGH